MYTVLKAWTDPRSTSSQEGSTPVTGGVGGAPAEAEAQRVVRLPSTAYCGPKLALCTLLEVAVLFSARFTPGGARSRVAAALVTGALAALFTVTVYAPAFEEVNRSEERRVGKQSK